MRSPGTLVAGACGPRCRRWSRRRGCRPRCRPRCRRRRRRRPSRRSPPPQRGGAPGVPTAVRHAGACTALRSDSAVFAPPQEDAQPTRQGGPSAPVVTRKGCAERRPEWTLPPSPVCGGPLGTSGDLSRGAARPATGATGAGWAGGRGRRSRSRSVGSTGGSACGSAGGPAGGPSGGARQSVRRSATSWASSSEKVVDPRTVRPGDRVGVEGDRAVAGQHASVDGDAGRHGDAVQREDASRGTSRRCPGSPSCRSASRRCRRWRR